MADRKAKMRARLQQKSRAMNLKYAADNLRCDRKVVITACLNHPGALIYCLDDKLRAELTGLSRAQLEALLETADEDMLPKLAEPVSEEQLEFEQLDFEAVLAQEKAEAALGASNAGGAGASGGIAGAPEPQQEAEADPEVEAEVDPEPEPEPEPGPAIDQSVEVDISVEVESAPDADATRDMNVCVRNAAGGARKRPMFPHEIDALAGRTPSIEEA
jgi:hypothetical protein